MLQTTYEGRKSQMRKIPELAVAAGSLALAVVFAVAAPATAADGGDGIETGVMSDIESPQ